MQNEIKTCFESQNTWISIVGANLLAPPKHRSRVLSRLEGVTLTVQGSLNQLFT